MPTYEFSCPEGHDFEKFYRTMSGAPSQVDCPVCGRPATRRVSGGAGLLFKGSGFYITDYGKDGKKDQNKDRKSPSGPAKPDTAPSDAGSATGGAGASSTSGSTKSDTAAAPASPPAAQGGE